MPICIDKWNEYNLLTTASVSTHSKTTLVNPLAVFIKAFYINQFHVAVFPSTIHTFIQQKTFIRKFLLALFPRTP